MARRWAEYEKQKLIDNYNNSTSRELEDLLPNRSVDSIRGEIKRLKKKKLLSGKKTKETVQRSYDNRL